MVELGFWFAVELRVGVVAEDNAFYQIVDSKDAQDTGSMLQAVSILKAFAHTGQDILCGKRW